MRHVCDESKLRLDGLNKALNNAIEEEAKTRAYLDTLREAIAGNRLNRILPAGAFYAKVKDICDRVIKNCNYDFGKSTKHIRISL